MPRLSRHHACTTPHGVFVRGCLLACFPVSCLMRNTIAALSTDNSRHLRYLSFVAHSETPGNTYTRGGDSVAPPRSRNTHEIAAMSDQAKSSYSLPNEGSTHPIVSSELFQDSSVQPNYTAIPITGGWKTGTIAHVCRVVLRALDFLIKSPAVASTESNQNILRHSHTSLRLWTDGHHVWGDGLERILELSKHMRYTTLSVLYSLCKALLLGMRSFEVDWKHTYALQGLKTHLTPYPDDSAASQLLKATADTCDLARLLLCSSEQHTTLDTDSSDDDEFDDDHSSCGIIRMTNAVKIYTNCLLDLSPALEFPAPDALYCPFFVAESRHGWPRTCYKVKCSNMAELRRHLTQPTSRGSKPHLAFLQLCYCCNEDFLDKDVYETRHGYKGELCNTRRPQRRGERRKVQWELLYRQVEQQLTAQRLPARKQLLSPT